MSQGKSLGILLLLILSMYSVSAQKCPSVRLKDSTLIEVLNRYDKHYPGEKVLILKFDGLSSHPIDTLGTIDTDYLIFIESIISFQELKEMPSLIGSYNKNPVLIYTGIEQLIEFPNGCIKDVFKKKNRRYTFPPSQKLFNVSGLKIYEL